MKQVRFFALFSFLLAVCCISLAAIALGTVRWLESFADNSHEGLFEACSTERCVSNGISNSDPPYIHATRAFLILGIAVLFVNLLILLVIAVKNGRPHLSKAAGCLFLLSGIFLLIATSVYTGINRPTLAENNQQFGFSLWVAWASTILTLLSTPFGFMAKPSLNYI